MYTCKMRTPTRTQDVRCTVIWVSVLCSPYVRDMYTNQNTGCEVNSYMSLSSLISSGDWIIYQAAHRDVRCTVTWVSVHCTLHVRESYTNQDTGCEVYSYMSLSSLLSTCERYIHHPGHWMWGVQLHEFHFLLSTCERYIHQPGHRMWGVQLHESQFSALYMWEIHTPSRTLDVRCTVTWVSLSALYMWENHTPTRTLDVRCTVRWVSVLCSLHVRDTYTIQDTGYEVYSYMSLTFCSLHVTDTYTNQDTGMWGVELRESQFGCCSLRETSAETNRLTWPWGVYVYWVWVVMFGFELRVSARVGCLWFLLRFFSFFVKRRN